MYHRYFTASARSPLVLRIIALHKQRIDASKTLMAFSKELKISAMYGTTPASYVFDFKHEDIKTLDMTAWKKTPVRRGTYYFVPRKNTPEGKALIERIKALPSCPQLDGALDAVPSLDHSFPVIIEGHTGYRPFIRYWNPKTKIAILSLPWRDCDAKELADYKAQRDGPKEGRNNWSATLDYLLWTPPEWLTEIKEWEALKIIEEAK